MSDPNILFLEVDPEDEAVITATFPTAHIENTTLSPEEIIQKYPDIEVLCVFIYSQITAELIQNLPHLKCIITRSVGYDHIDLRAAKEKSVIVGNVADYGAHVIAEHVFAILLSGLRHIAEGDERVEEDASFDFHGLRGTALQGKTLGIVGTGKIGMNVARIAARGFLMNVIAYDVAPDQKAAEENGFEYVDLQQIWEQSDIISFHVPLLPETKHLVNADTITQMKDGVILVNTARGGIIDSAALLAGLESGKVGYAALDVLEHEQNLQQEQALIRHPRVLTTPHIAFYADDSMQSMYRQALDSIKNFLAGDGVLHEVQGV